MLTKIETFRNTNILAEINSSNTGQLIDIYRPGTINPSSAIPDVSYSGFITSLRVAINIKSIGELQLPQTSPLDTAEDKARKQRESVLASPRILLNLYLRNSQLSTPSLVGSILIFNRFPYYYIPLIPYFSDNNTFDIAPDTTIAVQLQDVDYGLLKDDDKVTFIGSAIEEGVYFTYEETTNSLPPVTTEPSSLLDNSSLINNSFLLRN